MKSRYSFTMVSLIIFTAMLAFAPSAGAIPRERATKIERYLAQKNKLIISDIYPLGEVKEPLLVFEAIAAHESGISTNSGGVRVYTPTSKGGEYFFAYIDSDDIDGILKVIVSMIELHKEQHLGQGKSESRLYYSCRGGFMVELRESTSKPSIFIGGSHSSILLAPPDLTMLRTILEKAQEALQKNKVLNIPEDKFPEEESKTGP